MKRYEWTVEYSIEDSLYYIQKMIYMCCPEIHEKTFECALEAEHECLKLNELDAGFVY